MNNDTQGTRFLSGVTVLTLSTVIVKIIGLVYKIPLLRILGAEGMGYFNSAYELYTLFFVIATAGLPVAVSILISESVAGGRLRNVKRIYGVSFAAFIVIGFVGSLAMILFSHPLSRFLGDGKMTVCILAIAPTVFFVSVSSAVRGYFQGNGNMVPTAVSQVIEAAGKPLIGIALALWARSMGWSPAHAAAFAVVGVVVGTAISMLYLLIVREKRKISYGFVLVENAVDPRKRIFIGLLSLAAPITVSAVFSNITRVVDMTMILRRMTDIGHSSETAAALFGAYSTLAVPVFHLPSSLISGIAVSLIPGLTGAMESGSAERRDRLVGTALRLCVFVAIPCAVGLSAFSPCILSLLFSGETEAISIASPLLSLLGPAVLSTCLSSVTGAVLQAQKKAALPLVGMIVGAVVKMISAYILLGIPEVGMMGAPISTLFCNLVSVVVNFYLIERQKACALSLDKIFAKPICAAAISFSLSIGAYFALGSVLPEKVAFLITFLLCVILYLIFGSVLGAVEVEDLAMLPIREKYKKQFIEKLRMLKGRENGKQASDLRASEKEQLSI